MFLQTGNYSNSKCSVCGGDIMYMNGEWVHYSVMTTNTEYENTFSVCNSLNNMTKI